MSRPVSIQDDAILEAARQVFLKQGFRAPTTEVAKQAGVCEGSIFKRFPTKSALFMAAMNVETKEDVWQDQLLRSAGTGDMRQALETAGMHLIKQIQVILPRVMMIQSSGVTVAMDYYLPGKPPVIQHHELLAKYFRAEMKRGRIECDSPEVQAHAFVGSLYHYVICDFFHHYRPVPVAEYVGAVVGSLLRALKFARRTRRAARRPAAALQRTKGSRK